MQQLLSFFSFLTPLILEQVGLFFDILGIYNNLFTLKCRIKRDWIASSPHFQTITIYGRSASLAYQFVSFLYISCSAAQSAGIISYGSAPIALCHCQDPHIGFA